MSQSPMSEKNEAENTEDNLSEDYAPTEDLQQYQNQPLVIVVPPGGLVLATPDGRPLLSVADRGTHVQASLYDPWGREKIRMVAIPQESSLSFYSQNSATAVVSANPAGGRFDATSPNGTLVASMNASETGGAVFVANGEGSMLDGLPSEEAITKDPLTAMLYDPNLKIPLN